MAQYDDLYADAEIPITVEEAPLTPMASDITEAELEQYKSMPAEDLIAVMEGMTPEKRQAVYDMIFGNQDSELYEDDMLRGEDLEDMDAPGMRRMGRLHQAANPLEFIGVGAQRHKGRGMQDEAREAREKMMEQAAQGRALRGQYDLGL